MRILIVKTSSLGDIIHAFPTLHYLRKKFPQPGHKIDWVVEKPFAELLTAHPDLDNVLVIESKKWRKNPFFQGMLAFRKLLRAHTYDYVFDLQGNTKSTFVTLQTKSKNKIGFGFKTLSEWPNLFCTHHRYDPPKGSNIRDEYLFLAKSAFNDTSETEPDSPFLFTLTPAEERQLTSLLKEPFMRQSAPKILVCPGSAWRNKQMTEEGLLSLLHQYPKPCHFLFLWGTEEEKQRAENLHNHFSSTVLNKLSLPVLQHLMTHVDRVIAMDSLPLHLAGTTPTPTFSIFGPSSAEKYCPKGPQHIYFQGICPYGRTFERRCPILRTCKTGACIRGQQNVKPVSKSRS